MYTLWYIEPSQQIVCSLLQSMKPYQGLQNQVYIVTQRLCIILPSLFTSATICDKMHLKIHFEGLLQSTHC